LVGFLFVFVAAGAEGSWRGRGPGRGVCLLFPLLYCVSLRFFYMFLSLTFFMNELPLSNFLHLGLLPLDFSCAGLFSSLCLSRVRLGW